MQLRQWNGQQNLKILTHTTDLCVARFSVKATPEGCMLLGLVCTDFVSEK